MQLASCRRCSAAILATRRLNGHAALHCWIGAACLVASGNRPLVTFRYHACTACYTFQQLPLCTRCPMITLTILTCGSFTMVCAEDLLSAHSLHCSLRYHLQEAHGLLRRAVADTPGDEALTVAYERCEEELSLL